MYQIAVIQWNQSTGKVEIVATFSVREALQRDHAERYAALLQRGAETDHTYYTKRI